MVYGTEMDHRSQWDTRTDPLYLVDLTYLPLPTCLYRPTSTCLSLLLFLTSPRLLITSSHNDLPMTIRYNMTRHDTIIQEYHTSMKLLAKQLPFHSLPSIMSNHIAYSHCRIMNSSRVPYSRPPFPPSLLLSGSIFGFSWWFFSTILSIPSTLSSTLSSTSHRFPACPNTSQHSPALPRLLEDYLQGWFVTEFGPFQPF